MTSLHQDWIKVKELNWAEIYAESGFNNSAAFADELYNKTWYLSPEYSYRKKNRWVGMVSSGDSLSLKNSLIAKTLIHLGIQTGLLVYI